MVNRGFGGCRPDPAIAGRLPPGQTLTTDFPVLSAGPAPRVNRDARRFTLKVGPRPVASWTWAEFNALPQKQRVADIDCLTTWAKFDTARTGVTIDDLLAHAGVVPPTPFVLAHSIDDYSTNVPVADLVGGKAMIATHFDGKPLAPDDGGSARLLVPHLYFWKSAKWVNGLQFTERDEAGFRELRAYHMRSAPFAEERYDGD